MYSDMWSESVYLFARLQPNMPRNRGLSSMLYALRRSMCAFEVSENVPGPLHAMCSVDMLVVLSAQPVFHAMRGPM